MSHKEIPEYTEVRHPIDHDKLVKYLTTISSQSKNTTLGPHYPEYLKNISKLDIKQFTFGQSNPTYHITDLNTGKVFVLRKKPSPNSKLISRSAHAIEREFFILRGINILNLDQNDEDKKVPIPDVYALCEDESVIGYVFYVMEYIKGIQIKNPDMPGIPIDDQHKYWNSIVNTISSIHLLDAEKLISYLPSHHFPQFQNIDKLKGSSYFQRQIKTLKAIETKQSEYVDRIPDFDDLCKDILRLAPKDPAKLTLIHGDLKIDNILFDPETKKVKGILDWELCTIGHPLFDLSNFLQAFQVPNKLNLLLYKPQKTDIGRENNGSIDFIYKQLAKYNEKVTWDPKDLSNNATDLWLIGFTFGLLRLSIITQGIAMRVKQGNASSGNASGYASLYPYLSKLAREGIVEYESKKKLNKL
ncbi:protein serine/threonine kinase activity protein [Scheffersomyces amazonensis]|uniref:protein serine/threonine kinase activity protein n=1 Tax=Scheffersomyces amazonensis TaxID=1078765 RepID=UPI00315CABAA